MTSDPAPRVRLTAQQTRFAERLARMEEERNDTDRPDGGRRHAAVRSMRQQFRIGLCEPANELDPDPDHQHVTASRLTGTAFRWADERPSQ